MGVTLLSLESSSDVQVPEPIDSTIKNANLKDYILIALCSTLILLVLGLLYKSFCKKENKIDRSSIYLKASEMDETTFEHEVENFDFEDLIMQHRKGKNLEMEI